MLPTGDPPLAYRALWEKCGSAFACRVAICAQCVAPDEFAGVVAGYLDAGESVLEPFHVRFVREQAVYLVLGDLNVLTRKSSFAETWPRPVRAIIARARVRLRGICRTTVEGLMVASSAELARLAVLPRDPACAKSAQGVLDNRVWETISAHFGVPAGLEG
jgi:hypothetical protein